MLVFLIFSFPVVSLKLILRLIAVTPSEYFPAFLPEGAKLDALDEFRNTGTFSSQRLAIAHKKTVSEALNTVLILLPAAGR
jgi:hypothetical protein